MHRQITRLAELAVAHAQHTAGEIDIDAVEVQHLAHPHPGDGQQPQHRGIGQGPQSGGAGEGSRRGDERSDFGVAVQIGRTAAILPRQQPLRRDLVTWVNAVGVSGEARAPCSDGPPTGPAVHRAARWPIAARIRW